MEENMCTSHIQKEVNIKDRVRTQTTQQQKTDKKTTFDKKKRAEDPNRHFSKEDLQIVNRQIQSCSTTLILREMQFKTTRRYHFTSCYNGDYQKGKK